MKPTMNQIDEVLRSVLDVTLQLHPRDLERAIAGQGDPMIQAQIQFKGQWQGQVTLHIEPGLAREMAAAMTRLSVDEIGEETTQDAVGELANMIAGNLRPLVPGALSMTLPTVTQQRLEKLPESSFPFEMGYRLDGRALSIAVADAAALN